MLLLLLQRCAPLPLVLAQVVAHVMLVEVAAQAAAVAKTLAQAAAGPMILAQAAAQAAAAGGLAPNRQLPCLPLEHGHQLKACLLSLHAQACSCPLAPCQCLAGMPALPRHAL